MADPVFSTDCKNAAADAIAARFGAGGTLEILTAGDVLISEHDLNATPFDVASGGIAESNAIADSAAVSTGTPAKFNAKSAAGAIKISGTVGAGSGELHLDNGYVAITSGQNIVIADGALKITVP